MAPTDLVFCFEKAGVLRNADDETSLIPRITAESYVELKASGVVNRGMIPKIDCAVEAVRSGVTSTVILDGRIPHSILIELLSDEGVGTMITV